MKKIVKKYDYLLVTFIISMISMVIIYILKSVAPFGKGSLLTIDFFHQYGPMLGELYDRVVGKLDLLYSFRMGLGLPFYRNFFNYLSSPLNVLMLFFKHKQLLTSFSVIIAVKASLSAVTMCYYLNKKFNKNYLFVGLSILYAFCAYFTAFYWNIMWLDGMLMLPLVVYGIEKLVDENKCLLYIVSLVIIMFASYYMAYMICIFSVLYFATYLIINNSDDLTSKKTLNKILYFIISSLIAAGLCAVFIFPIYEAMRSISATGDAVPTSQYYDFTVAEFIFGHLSGVKATVLKSDIANAPNVSTSILSIGLLILFICNKKIDYKVKIGYIFLLLFLILSYAIAPIDFVWHGFHTPNDLPYRYSFTYSFIMIVIAAYSLDKIKDLKKISVIAAYIALIMYIVLAMIFKYKCLSNTLFIVNYLLVTIYFLLYILSILCKNKTKFIKVLKLAFIFVIAAESIIAIDNNWTIDTEQSELYESYDYIQDTIKYLKEKDDDIYRMEKENCISFSDPSWFGYNGQVGFSSMEYEPLASEQYDLGMPGNYINSFYYRENTPIYNMMFNLKYIIGNVRVEKNFTIYDKDQNIYKSNYNIGLMYGVNEDIKDFKVRKDTPLENQNSFIELSTNVGEVLERLDTKSRVTGNDAKGTTVEYTFDVDKDNDIIYAYFPNGDIKYARLGDKIYKPDSEYQDDNYENINYETDSYGERYVISDTLKTGNNKLDIKYEDYQRVYDDAVQLYRINYKKLDDAYDKLNSQKAKITEFKESHITAESDFKEDLTMYTSIPYDIGWKVYIDGKETKTFKISNSLLGFDVKTGHHKIELKYEIPHLKEGLCVSTISLIGLIGLVHKTKPIKKTTKSKKTK